MSETVRSYGFIAVLKNPVGDRGKCSEVSETLWAAKTDLDINYDGTLAFIDYNQYADYDTRTNIYSLFFGGVTTEGRPTDLIVEAIKHGLEIDPASIRSFNCIWYNGSDNPVSTLTKDEFLTQTGNNPALLPNIPPVTNGTTPKDIEYLKEQHGGTWGSHPEHSRKDWRFETTNDDNSLGYWEWVAKRLGES